MRRRRKLAAQDSLSQTTLDLFFNVKKKVVPKDSSAENNKPPPAKRDDYEFGDLESQFNPCSQVQSLECTQNRIMQVTKCIPLSKRIDKLKPRALERHDSEQLGLFEEGILEVSILEDDVLTKSMDWTSLNDENKDHLKKSLKRSSDSEIVPIKRLSLKKHSQQSIDSDESECILLESSPLKNLFRHSLCKQSSMKTKQHDMISDDESENAAEKIGIKVMDEVKIKDELFELDENFEFIPGHNSDYVQIKDEPNECIRFSASDICVEEDKHFCTDTIKKFISDSCETNEIEDKLFITDAQSIKVTDSRLMNCSEVKEESKSAIIMESVVCDNNFMPVDKIISPSDSQRSIVDVLEVKEENISDSQKTIVEVLDIKEELISDSQKTVVEVSAANDDYASDSQETIIEECSSTSSILGNGNDENISDLQKTIVEITEEPISDSQKTIVEVFEAGDDYISDSQETIIKEFTSTSRVLENGKPNSDLDTTLIVDFNDYGINESELIMNNSNAVEFHNYTLKNFNKIMSTVSSNEHLFSLLSAKDRNMLMEFQELSGKHQYLCLKLYMRLPKWYRMVNFLSEINMKLPEPEAAEIFNTLKEKEIIFTDYSREPAGKLLNNLSREVVLSIFNSFKIKRRPKQKKESLIEDLLTHCSTQTTLSGISSTTILMKRIVDNMGACLKLHTDVYYFLFRLHLLYSFTEKDIIKPSELYFRMGKIDAKEIVLPEYEINTTVFPFNCSEDFNRYAMATEYANDYDIAKDKKDRFNMIRLAECVYEELSKEVETSTASVITALPFFKRFTAGHVLTQTLSTACTDLATEVEHVLQWVPLLLRQIIFCPKKRGSWYVRLATIYSTYMKDQDMAAQTVAHALCDPQVNIVDRYELSIRAERLICRKSNRPHEDTLDMLKSVQLPTLKGWPNSVTEATPAPPSKDAGKKLYLHPIEDGMTYLTVEYVALKYYEGVGFPHGLHCEGGLMTTLMFLFFWDTIYEANLPGTFISELQYVPLDFYSKDFYLSRRDRIDERLNDIRKDWTLKKLLCVLTQSSEEYGDKFGLMVRHIAGDPLVLAEAVQCIGRDVLANILERLIRDYRTFHSGMPDLFVWNIATQTCKFAEVKSERDKLSTKQKMWLQFLRSVGADAEVCHVNSKGSRIKKVLE